MHFGAIHDSPPGIRCQTAEVGFGSLGELNLEGFRHKMTFKKPFWSIVAQGGNLLHLLEP